MSNKSGINSTTPGSTTSNKSSTNTTTQVTTTSINSGTNTTTPVSTTSNKLGSNTTTPVSTTSNRSGKNTTTPVSTTSNKSGKNTTTPVSSTSTKSGTHTTTTVSTMCNKSGTNTTTTVFSTFNKSDTNTTNPVCTMSNKSGINSTTQVCTMSNKSGTNTTTPVSTLSIKSSTNTTTPVFTTSNKSDTNTTNPVSTMSNKSGINSTTQVCTMSNKSGTNTTTPVSTISNKSSANATATSSITSNKSNTNTTTPVSFTSHKSGTNTTTPVSTMSYKSGTNSTTPLTTTSNKSDTNTTNPVSTMSNKSGINSTTQVCIMSNKSGTNTTTPVSTMFNKSSSISDNTASASTTKSSFDGCFVSVAGVKRGLTYDNFESFSKSRAITTSAYSSMDSNSVQENVQVTCSEQCAQTSLNHIQINKSTATTVSSSIRPNVLESNEVQTSDEVVDRSVYNQWRCEEWNLLEEIVTSVILWRQGVQTPSTFHIDIKRANEPDLECLLLQVTNLKTHAIFQTFIRNSRASELRHFMCPYDVLEASSATVTVHGVRMSGVNNRLWYTVLTGDKKTVLFRDGLNYTYLMMNTQPIRTYQDLLADNSKKESYHVTVVSTGPRRYMLTDLQHRDEHTDAFIITLCQTHPPAACIMIYYGSETKYEIPYDLKPATEYKLQLCRVCTRYIMDDVFFIGNSHSTVTTFTANMTQNEVLELYIKATRFVLRRPPNYFNISHFYRTKSEVYFSNIMTTDGVMHKYDKNWGGDQASTLNKQVQGLFFSTTVNQVTRLPPDFSYFGPVRLHVPTYFLLNNNMNMYFSDFYCHYYNHKVQLVLTVKGSPTDHFCRQRLVLVDQTNNPFLMRCGFTEIVRVTMNVTVEVFYTGDLPVADLLWFSNVFFTTTKQKGNALSMVKGIPKNRDGGVCNLDCFLLAHNML
ncbi:mucin-17-like [Mizuhopecten yessoensis]|uniref:mucin-17-like n=1 Tax=Mizuhopecten yessoensis TaxID=6573 RepID=UPI000B45F679|nr:mucin-17-like [Mizuhopecten yessoensis]